MTIFNARVKMRGANGRTVTKVFNLGNFTGATSAVDFVAAENALNQIVGALTAVTDATITEATLTNVFLTNVAAGAGDLFENAMINVHLDAGGDKLAQVYIPAAKIDVFAAPTGSARDRIDITDALLIQYIQQLSQHSLISDGEQIDVTASNGMKDGRRVVKAVRLGN